MFLLPLARWLASGLGSGYSLVAPGTCGSVTALLFWWILQMGEVVPDAQFQVVASLLVVVVGLLATSLVVGRDVESKDPQWIVVDEWAGIFISLVYVSPSSLLHMFLAFALFRVFDVIKPGPVRWAEQLPGAWGVMADDIVAGISAFGVMRLVV